MFVNLDISINKKALISSLKRMSRGDLLEFIKDLDLNMQDCDFTYALYKYFKQEWLSEHDHDCKGSYDTNTDTCDICGKHK